MLTFEEILIITRIVRLQHMALFQCVFFDGLIDIFKI